ncbi:MAG: division/cell wall cluster transcriptional repressor MraZ [Acetobacteraceae bacterium]
MSPFMGSHQNKLDGKGRVSIPAPFRALLRRYAGSAGDDAACRMVLRRSHQLPCVEAWPEAVFAYLLRQLDRIPMFSRAYDAMGTAMFAEVMAVETDREGRIALPDPMAAHAGIVGPAGVVQFVGFGRHFRLWHPDAWAAEQQRAREFAASEQLTVMLDGFEVPA